MSLFLSICIVIMPWVVFPFAQIQDQMRAPQAMFMDIMFIGIIIFYFLNGAKYVYRNKYLAMLVACIGINFAWHFLFPFFWEVKGVGRAVNLWMLEPILHTSLGLMALMAIATNFDEKDFERVARAICFSGMLVGSIACLQYIGLDIFGKSALYVCGNRIAACLDNPNLVSNYLALCIPLYLIFIRELKYILWLVIASLGLFATSSELGIGLYILILILYTSIKFRIALYTYICALPILIIGAILKWSIISRFLLDHASGRMDAWTIAWTRLHDNPIFGQGLGIWKSWNIYIKTTFWYSIHNDWLERAVELGIIGLVLILLVVVNSIRNARLTKDLNIGYFISFIVFLVMALGSFPLETATIATLGLVSFIAVEKL